MEKHLHRKKQRKKRIIAMIILIIAVAASTFELATFLPTIGELNTPANSYISEYYIENAVEDTHSYNIVTAVLADYRGFDTLFETCVMFLSGITAMMVLSTKDKVSKSIEINSDDVNIFESDIMDNAFRIIIPIIMIYGIYVLAHGEISLGGGFQAGALLASAYLLDKIIPGFRTVLDRITEEFALIVAGVGSFIYLSTGLLPMFNGGNFLEYGKFPFGSKSIEAVGYLHSTGILLIEVGVTICVAGVIIAILEVVLERTSFDE